jgi:hypothetical protein
VSRARFAITRAHGGVRRSGIAPAESIREDCMTETDNNVSGAPAAVAQSALCSKCRQNLPVFLDMADGCD